MPLKPHIVAILRQILVETSVFPDPHAAPSEINVSEIPDLAAP